MRTMMSIRKEKPRTTPSSSDNNLVAAALSNKDYLKPIEQYFTYDWDKWQKDLDEAAEQLYEQIRNHMKDWSDYIDRKYPVLQLGYEGIGAVGGAAKGEGSGLSGCGGGGDKPTENVVGKPTTSSNKGPGRNEGLKNNPVRMIKPITPPNKPVVVTTPTTIPSNCVLRSPPPRQNPSGVAPPPPAKPKPPLTTTTTKAPPQPPKHLPNTQSPRTTTQTYKPPPNRKYRPPPPRRSSSRSRPAPFRESDFVSPPMSPRSRRTGGRGFSSTSPARPNHDVFLMVDDDWDSNEPKESRESVIARLRSVSNVTYFNHNVGTYSCSNNGGETASGCSGARGRGAGGGGESTHQSGRGAKSMV